MSFDSGARLFVDGQRYTRNAYGYMQNASPRLDIGHCSQANWCDSFQGDLD